MSERILVMGVPGSGKSYQWLLMARALREQCKFHCLDTDDAINFMLDSQFPDLKPSAGGNVHVYPAYDWKEYMTNSKEIMKIVSEKDWIVLDMADNAWNAVQRHFVTEVFKEDIGQYFLEVRRALHQRGDIDSKGRMITSLMNEALKGWVDWTVINKLYEDWILPLVYATKANLYATTKVSEVSREDEALTRQVFGAYGVKPAGQKHLGHQVHTIFLFIPPISREDKVWRITTIKDRAGRQYFDNDPLINLYKQYFVK